MTKKIFAILAVLLLAVNINVEAQTVVSGTILKADGRPVEENVAVVVSLMVDGKEQSMPNAISSGTLVSAELNGDFSISVLEGQEIFLKFTAYRLLNGKSAFSPYAVVEYHTEVKYTGQKVLNVRFSADGEITLKGKIYPPSEWGGVEILSLDRTFGRTRPAFDGVYTIEGLPPGDYEVRAVNLNGTVATKISLNPNQHIVELDLQVKP